MIKPYKLSIVIGRFQPLHNEHVNLIAQAIALADHTLILMGSATEARSTKNPFDYWERWGMIDDHFGDKVNVVPTSDYRYNNEVWADAIRTKVKSFLKFKGLAIATKDVCIVGHDKDASTFYLKLFPEVQVEPYNQGIQLSSTNIRHVMFGGRANGFSHEYKQVPPATSIMLAEAFGRPWFHKLYAEYQAAQAYRESWAAAPFPPVFVATDNLVLTREQEIILITRKSEFGNGLLAMPGGYLDHDETVYAGALRELREETNIRSENVYSLGDPVMFDDPGRSQRGRMLTHVFPWHLKAHTRPEIVAGDDAATIERVAISELQLHQPKFFSDHFHIIYNMLKRMGKL